jgi:hypothetical protein
MIALRAPTTANKLPLLRADGGGRSDATERRSHGSVSHLGASLSLVLTQENTMNRIIYIVGLVVVVLAVLAFFGMR